MQPHLQQRGEQPYVAIQRRVTTAQISRELPPLADQVAEWLKQHGQQPSGAPFFRYFLTDMAGEGQFEVAVGFPVAVPLTGSGDVVAGSFPAGTYAVLSFIGPYDRLTEAHGLLQKWCADQGIRLRQDGEHTWGAMIESYETDEMAQPDSSKWQTDIFYLIEQ
ncbi:MAG: GyrI-like domain-containing protein [Roseiflexaceae bacterium]